MPPKGKDKQGSSSKVAVDKTFGMKNKKGGKGQKTVALIQQQQKTAGKSKEQLAREKQKKPTKKPPPSLQRKSPPTRSTTSSNQKFPSASILKPSRAPSGRPDGAIKAQNASTRTVTMPEEDGEEGSLRRHARRRRG